MNKHKPTLLKRQNITEQQLKGYGSTSLKVILIITLAVFAGTLAIVSGLPINPNLNFLINNNNTYPQIKGALPTQADNASLQLYTFTPSAQPTLQLTPQPTPQSTISSGNNIISVTSSFSEFGFTINLSFQYPEDGGILTGNATGACNGPITGMFQGPPSGNVSGSIMGVCSTLGWLISSKSTLTFTGSINAANSQATIQYVTSLFGMNESGTQILQLIQTN